MEGFFTLQNIDIEKKIEIFHFKYFIFKRRAFFRQEHCVGEQIITDLTMGEWAQNHIYHDKQVKWQCMALPTIWPLYIHIFHLL